jgi:dihydroxyacetone kinase-like protein
MSKAVGDRSALDQQKFSEIFTQGVEAVKKRGKAEAGEKTMLDVLIPVAENMSLGADASAALPDYWAVCWQLKGVHLIWKKKV